MRALESLGGATPWPAGSTLALVRNGSQQAFSDHPAMRGLRVLQLQDDGLRWEFGAWQRGIDAVRAEVTPQAWLLLNDTAGVNDPWPVAERRRLRLLADELAADPLAGPVLAGAMSKAPAGAALLGHALAGWVQTHAFVLSSRALEALGWRVFDADLFDAPLVHDGRLELPPSVSPELAAHVAGWLTRPGRTGWLHHSGRRHVSDELLRNKAGSVLLEKRLSALVMAARGTLYDCRQIPAGPLAPLARRMFYWQRRLVLALSRYRPA